MKTYICPFCNTSQFLSIKLEDELTCNRVASVSCTTCNKSYIIGAARTGNCYMIDFNSGKISGPLLKGEPITREKIIENLQNQITNYLKGEDGK